MVIATRSAQTFAPALRKPAGIGRGYSRRLVLSGGEKSLAAREVPSSSRQAVPSTAELPEKLRAEPTTDNRARRSSSSEPGLAVNTRSFSVRFSAVKT